MTKAQFIRRIFNAVAGGRFNHENYFCGGTWHGELITTEPRRCSYGRIGFSLLWEVEPHRPITLFDYDWEWEEFTFSKEAQNIISEALRQELKSAKSKQKNH